MTSFFFLQCVIKQLLDSVCDIHDNQGLGKASASAENHCLDLDYSGYHKNLIQ